MSRALSECASTRVFFELVRPFRMNRSETLSVVVALAAVTAAVAGWRVYHAKPPERPISPTAKLPLPPVPAPDAPRVRETLFAELQPVLLKNCVVKRFGESHDGGYLLCANLLGGVRSGYSYGISGYDGWGCDVSRTLRVPVHQYDCFNLQEPVCAGGRTTFHGECVAGERSTDAGGRVFETPEHQFARNGDATNHLVMKIDVEGAEWDTFLKTPDSVVERIDQLAVEFHGVDKPRYIEAVKKLKRIFYVANLHFNNYSCSTRLAPFPAWAYEVLFVNKQLGIPDTSGKRPVLDAANAPNNPERPDCQAVDASAGRPNGGGAPTQ
jgi:hypothetical protein